MSYIFKSILISGLIIEISGFKTHSALNAIIFTNIEAPLRDVHSEYYFGKCATARKILLAHEHYKYDQVKGKVMIRGYYDIPKIPNCIYIKASSPFGDMVKYNAYKFNICTSRIVYNYLGQTFNYNSYEWFIPVEMQEGIDWDLYFFRTTF